MEQTPILEMRPKNSELSLDDQVALAETLVEAKRRKISLPGEIEERNNKMYAGSALTPEYSDEDMQALKEADLAFTQAVRALEDSIPDKGAFIELLEQSGKKDLAKSVARAFEIHKDNILQRLFKKVAA